MTTNLVTGGAGFIGGTLVRQWLAEEAGRLVNLYRPGHDRRYAIDSTKIARQLGWRPGVDFETGLRQTVAWYLDHPQWVERVASGKYRRERLGLSPSA